MKAVVFSSGANAIDKINGITTVTGASYTWTGVLNPTLSLAVTINSLTHNNGTSQFVQYADVERNAA